MSSPISPKIVVAARFCAPDDFDQKKLALYVNKNIDRVGYADLNGLYGKVHQALIDKGMTPASINNINPTFTNYLDSFERKNDQIVIDLRITNFSVFFKTIALLKQRYSDLSIFLVIGNPLDYYNTFCHSRNNQARINSSRYYYKYELYRLDKLLYPLQNICGEGNFILSSSTQRVENEKNLFSYLGLEYPEHLAALPFPSSFEGHELNRFSGLPTWLDLFGFEKWREAIAEWESAKNLGRSRSLPIDNFLELYKVLNKHSRFVKLKYPELLKVLDQSTIDTFSSLNDYNPLSSQYIKSFINFIPPEKRRDIKKSFRILRRGLPEFYIPLFAGLDDDGAIEVGDDLSIPKCAVLTFTYNHEKYIAECLDSVANQQIDFPIEHIVVDDASSDNTAAIVSAYSARYPHIKPILFRSKPPNPIYPAFQCCKSKFVALCDGDDYFCDENKLKSQIDFLERNRDCHLAFHLTEVFYEDDTPSYVYSPGDIVPGATKSIYTLEDLLQGNLMQTSSVVYRWRFSDGLPPWFNANLQPGDWYWHLLHAELGNIGFIPRVMSRYRRHSSAVYASAEKGALSHRARYGMKELEMYQHCDEHFHFRYHDSFSRLATGVFANFTQTFSSTGNSELLDLATANYPAFAKDFLFNLEKVNKASVHTQE